MSFGTTTNCKNFATFTKIAIYPKLRLAGPAAFGKLCDVVI
jgi:hypothetical protein